MNAVGGILAFLLLLGTVAWVGWTFRQADKTVREIAVRMPSEAEFDAMPLAQTAEELKLAMNDCARIVELEANAVARVIKGDEIAALRQHCDLIKARQDALSGP